MIPPWDEEQRKDPEQRGEDDEGEDGQVAHRTTVAYTSSTIARPAAMPRP